MYLEGWEILSVVVFLVFAPVPRVLQIDAKLNILMVKRKCNFATFQRIDDVST